MYETLRIAVDHHRRTVSLDRPEVHNAFNAKLIEELTDAFSPRAARRHTAVGGAAGVDVRATVLRGNGKSFCAGADVGWMRESLELTEQANLEDALRMSDMFSAIDSTSHAVIGRVHGSALGGGMGLIAVCDIVVAADNTRFGFTDSRLGIIPAVISRFVVPKIGASWARRLFLTGERFDAKRAQEIGLVHDVVPEDDLDVTVDRIVEELQSAGPEAVREAKSLITGLASRPASEHREFTAGRIAAVRTSPEGQEGLRAFLEKRPPHWRDVS